MSKVIVWINGMQVPATEKILKLLTPGVVRRRGVFETMKAVEGRIVGIDEHLRRLRAGLKKLKIKSPLSNSKIRRTLAELTQQAPPKPLRIRLSVWKQSGAVHTAVVIASCPLTPKRFYQRGMKAAVAHQRISQRPLLGNIKSLDYARYLNAFERAQTKGYDEAILLNRKGELVEGSRTNIFLVSQGKLYTPALHSGCLEGTVRKRILKLAKQNRLRCQPTTLSLKELQAADEAFLTNAWMSIMPLTSINNRPVGSGRVGGVTKRLMKEYQREL